MLALLRLLPALAGAFPSAHRAHSSVCSVHLEEQRRHLGPGEERTDDPIRESAIKPLPTSAFKGLGDLELAQAGSNYVRRVSEQIRVIARTWLDWVLLARSVDALNAFSLLISYGC